MQISIAVIGGGPAGLMAADALIKRGHTVHLFDAMPSLGRKFLMAGKSGLNLTHAEPFDVFLSRFEKASADLEPALRALAPDAVQQWAEKLGTETFVGSSGRVFPKSMKAAPLLRSWLKELRGQGLITHVRHKWVGWSPTDALLFETPDGTVEVEAQACVLALGGGSWPSLGSDGAWVSLLGAQGVDVQPLKSANCGFDVDWSEHFRDRFAGAPVKSVMLSHGGRRLPGEFVVTQKGVEGGGIYTHAARLRDAIAENGSAVLTLDLAPGVDQARLEEKLGRPRGSRSFATHLKKTTGIIGVKAGLLRECASDQLTTPASIAAAIKNVPLVLASPRPMEEVISTAGGVAFSELDEGFMVTAKPGLFCAGEMLDWEAPTGGYLLNACMAIGRQAGEAAASYLDVRNGGDDGTHSDQSPG